MVRLLRNATMGNGSGKLLLAIVCIASITVLAFHGTIDSSTFVAMMAPIIGVVAGSAITQHNVDHTLDKVTQPGGKRGYDPPAEEGSATDE